MYPDFLGGPVVRTLSPMQGAWVPSLVGELRFCMPCGTPKRKKKRTLRGKKILKTCIQQIYYGTECKHHCFGFRMKISLQRNVIFEESFFLFFPQIPQTQVSGSSKAPLFWCWADLGGERTWPETGQEVSLRSRWESGLNLLFTESYFLPVPISRRGYTICGAQGNVEMWGSMFKNHSEFWDTVSDGLTHAGLTVLRLSLPPPLPSSKLTPGTFLSWSTGWREGREMFPQFVLFAIFFMPSPSCWERGGPGKIPQRLHLVSESCRGPEVCLLPHESTEGGNPLVADLIHLCCAYRRLKRKSSAPCVTWG